MEIPNRIKEILILCLAFVLLSGGIHYLVNKPLGTMAKRLESELKSKQHDLMQSRNLITVVPNPRKAMEEIQQKMEEFKSSGVNKKQLPKIIQTLGSSTAKFNVNVHSIHAKPEMKSEEKLPEGISKVYVEMSLSGPYFQIGEYLKSLSEQKPHFQVETMNITSYSLNRGMQSSKGKENNPKDWVSAVVLLSTYAFLEL